MAKKMKKETKKLKENNKPVLQEEPIFRFDRNNACMIVEFEDGKQITIQFDALEFAAFLLKVTNEIYCSKNNIENRYRLDDLGDKLKDFRASLEDIDIEYIEWLIAFKRSARFQKNSNTTQDARRALSAARKRMEGEFKKNGIILPENNNIIDMLLPAWNRKITYPLDMIKLEGPDPYFEAAKGQLVFPEYGVTLSKDRTEIKLIPDGIEGEFKIPETVTKLEDENIFKKCKKITSILIPESVISVDKYVFSACENLERIEVVEENPVYKSINGMLLNKEGTEIILVPNGTRGELQIPKSVTKIAGFGSGEYIGRNPFCDCNRLESIEVVEKNPIYKSINGMILCKKENKLIFVPKGIKGELQIPESVTEIGCGAFEDCIGLTSITIPESVREIGLGAFTGCTGLERIDVAEGNPVYKSIKGMLFNKEGTELIFVPKGIKGELQIPEGVDTIGYGAFKDCIGLSSVIIREGVSVIGYDAFNNCTGLSSIIIPESVYEIGEAAFSRCDSLEEIYFKGDEPKIRAPRDEDGELLNCEVLFWRLNKNLNLKLYYRKGSKDWGDTFDGLPIEAKRDSVIESEGLQIELYSDGPAVVLKGKSSLTKAVIIPSSIEHNGVIYPVTEIGKCAFEGCLGLTCMTIPEGVTEIGVAAFYGCTGLTSIIIPKSVTKIGRRAFEGCTGLTSIIIPEGVTDIGEGAISGCTGLERIDVAVGNPVYKSINGMFLMETKFKRENELIFILKGRIKRELQIPEGVTEISSDVFVGYTELTSIVIPKSVTEIGCWAFEDCTGLERIEVVRGNLEYKSINGILFNKEGTELICVPMGIKGKIQIPKSVTKIREYAFWYCTSLKEIHFEGDAPNLDCDVFKNVQATVYYRKGTKGWKETFGGLPTKKIL